MLCAGDTLFALGCGRLFEGSAGQMWASLSKMLPLPRSATVFCAHEYTQVGRCPAPRKMRPHCCSVATLQPKAICYMSAKRSSFTSFCCPWRAIVLCG